MSSSEFYNNFVAYQISSGINDRIYHLYKRLCRIGLRVNDDILEIGCGIGSLTYLMSRKITKGHIIAVDISPKSIEYAKTHLSRPNLSFFSADILNFEPDVKRFDKILLLDVLEHIPEENHVELFSKISKWLNDHALLLINFPNPNYILFDQKNNPQALQEIDQPIFIDRLAHSLAKASLDIEYFETYSVWVKHDYQFLVITKRKEFVELKLNSGRSLLERLKIRLCREVRKLIYRYPVTNN